MKLLDWYRILDWINHASISPFFFNTTQLSRRQSREFSKHRDKLHVVNQLNVIERFQRIIFINEFYWAK